MKRCGEWKMWKQIEGYKWPYRINEDGEIQKFYEGEWVDLHPYISSNRGRAMVKMRTKDSEPVDVPMVWLMADAFMGGRREGYAIIHKDGMKLNNAIWNLAFVPMKKVGLLSYKCRRKAVLKIDRDGNTVCHLTPKGQKKRKKLNPILPMSSGARSANIGAVYEQLVLAFATIC